VKRKSLAVRIRREHRWLDERGLLDNWIAIDTRRNPDDLARVIPLLEHRLGA